MNQKYITITEGEDYRTIATKMTDLGYKMNHATARNILLSGMRKFVGNIASELGCSMSESDSQRLVMRQDVHEVIGDVLTLCLKEQQEELISCPVAKQQ
jgi:hypothetical protein